MFKRVGNDGDTWATENKYIIYITVDLRNSGRDWSAIKIRRTKTFYDEERTIFSYVEVVHNASWKYFNTYRRKFLCIHIYISKFHQ